ncbi:TrkA-N domain protein [Denitrovibrio acetiphilus DSM 12809]|jgi:trk system potassium uptake protein TrkA|uniref:Trk system potassium uptake protein TrkA n=1 Tax=Denitrovibrio acetiphilus (strain DSM 12809 / NBRC 114555 / N2460) TaxID=522772 RepID=D4H732_DENA2|nr:Trk system potassium transporter TrkA [Denitrovibrio acetiphilus]ADD69736.1 TrkA-N domain protein [Denitrovibrio acetiphilus DSM 12809]
MKIVVAGAGEVGFHIADHLIKEGKDVVLIEKDADRAKFASSHLDCLVITGEASNLEILKQAGIQKADGFISATDYDEVNMITCFIVASEYDVPVKIARVRNMEYSKTRLVGQKYSGIDYIVNPEIEAAKSIASTVQHGATSDIFLFGNSDIQLRDIFVDEDSFFNGKSLKQIKTEIKEDFIIAGIMRETEVIVPTGDSVVQDKDHIYIIAAKNTFLQILKKTGTKLRNLHTVVVLGGGKIGRYVTEFLIKMGKNVKIVDKDYEKCKKLASDYPDIMVLNGDISDESLFEEENLHKADAIVTTTKNEELNILAAIYGKSKGIKRSVALVNKSNYLNIADDLGIDSTVSPKLSSVNAILKHIRRGNIKSVYKIFDGKAEVSEFSVQREAPVSGKALKDIKLPSGSLILAVIRGGQNIIPDGNFALESGDSVITFCIKDTADSLQKFFSGR